MFGLGQEVDKMYLIKELDIEVAEKELIKEALKFNLVYQVIPPNEIVIYEKDQIEAINAPALSGIRKKSKNGQVIVSFKTPLYDVTYPYPGSSEKIVDFLKLLHKNYGGKLKIKKLRG